MNWELAKLLALLCVCSHTFPRGSSSILECFATCLHLLKTSSSSFKELLYEIPLPHFSLIFLIGINTSRK